MTILKRGKTLVLVLAALLACAALAAARGQAAAGEKVQLTMGSWRADDVANWNAILGEFSAKYPNIAIKFDPTNPPDYNATLRQQFEAGIAPDLMYARTYDTGVSLFKSGYFADVTDLPGLKDQYDANARAPWADENGRSFAVPLAAVSHGVYYNQDIFRKHNLEIPQTWEDFLALCKTLKDAGVTPLANSLKDQWDINEVVLMSIAPNFIGGAEGRKAYEDGVRKFSDAQIVAIFQALKDMVPYLPRGFEALTYNDSSSLLATEQAAMYFDGSWSINNYKDVKFNWSVFAPPPPRGMKPYVTFHIDAGLAMNAKTKYPEQSRTFLQWVYSDEAASLLSNKLPLGFFPMARNAAKIDDPHANAFLELNAGRGTDVRLTWPRLMTAPSGEVAGYNLFNQAAVSVMTGKMTPQEAADSVQAGLAKYYAPQMK
jgi:raffinose/stachyose/melibiose transport system substrate-binding protein